MTSDDSKVAAGYEVLGELGRGGLGVVVLARQRALDRLVAIKRVRGRVAINSDASRLRREAQILGRLNHPNIVARIRLPQRRGRRPHRDGVRRRSSLNRLMARGLPLTNGAISVLDDVAAALTHVHVQGIVHRDVKPSNVIVADGGRAKLGDFGLARVLGSSSALRTRPGAVMGTPAYMAPEQILGEATDARTDHTPLPRWPTRCSPDAPCSSETMRARSSTRTCSRCRSPRRTSSQGFPGPRRTPSSPGWQRLRLYARPCPTSPVQSSGARARVARDSACPDAARPAAAEPMRTEGSAEPGEIIVATHEPLDARDGAPIAVPVFVPPRTPRRKGRAIGIVVAVALAAALDLRGRACAPRWELRSRDSSVARRGQSDHGRVPASDVHVFGDDRRRRRAAATHTCSGSVPTANAPPCRRCTSRVERRPRASLRFTVDGATPTDVTAELHVLTPTPRSEMSPPAHYACPEAFGRPCVSLWRPPRASDLQAELSSEHRGQPGEKPMFTRKQEDTATKGPWRALRTLVAFGLHSAAAVTAARVAGHATVYTYGWGKGTTTIKCATFISTKRISTCR